MTKHNIFCVKETFKARNRVKVSRQPGIVLWQAEFRQEEHGRTELSRKRVRDRSRQGSHL